MTKGVKAIGNAVKLAAIAVVGWTAVYFVVRFIAYYSLNAAGVFESIQEFDSAEVVVILRIIYIVLASMSVLAAFVVGFISKLPDVGEK